jgi:hypothetical protein
MPSTGFGAMQKFRPEVALGHPPYIGRMNVGEQNVLCRRERQFCTVVRMMAPLCSLLLFDMSCISDPDTVNCLCCVPCKHFSQLMLIGV